MTESFWVVDVLAREVLLFAGVGLLIGGLDDVLVDLVFLARRVMPGRRAALTLATLPPPRRRGGIAVFVPAWDESAVIGAMLSTALARYDHDDYRIFVGAYPNDRATIDAVAAVAERDDRIVLAIAPHDGPTTKADCLNTLWRAFRRDSTCADVKAIVLHDAEDVVDRHELRVIDSLIDRYEVVQLPVIPLVHPDGRLVSGTYADEFAESHGKQMIVRTALGAGMPLAGTGCAIAPEVLAMIAQARGGDPFDATSLTEDYELGLRLAELGARGLFARVATDDGGVVAVRAYFPTTVRQAVRQKARWMIGIALAGWDRTGWARPMALADHWMRARDRRALPAVVVLATAYAAIPIGLFAMLLHWIDGRPLSIVPVWMLVANMALLGWRLAMRMAFTARGYGGREALCTVPRFVVGNLVALFAAPRALVLYVGMLRGAPPVWDKTGHDFPDLSDPQAAPAADAVQAARG